MRISNLAEVEYAIIAEALAMCMDDMQEYGISYYTYLRVLYKVDPAKAKPWIEMAEKEDSQFNRKLIECLP